MPFEERIRLLKPLFENHKNRISYRIFTREQRHEIECTNRYFFHKLDNTKKRKFMNLKKWEDDFQKTRKFKENICSFPCIDFHKTMQNQIDCERNERKNNFNNTTLNFNNNKFNKTKFKDVSCYSIKKNKNKKSEENDINNEHFSNGETMVKDENKDIELIFIYGKNNDEIKVKCKIKDFFYEVVDKFCKENNLDKDKIEEYKKKDKPDKDNYIDLYDSIGNNNLNENDQIIVVMKKR